MQARVAFKHDEVPIGAIVVDKDGQIIGRGYNRTEHDGCQLGHAEIRAIQKACKKIDGWRLDGCTIYISLEPCLMCFGLITLSRIRHIVFGSRSPLFGSGLDNMDGFPLYKKGLVIVGNILEQDSVQLLQQFFKKRRSEKG